MVSIAVTLGGISRNTLAFNLSDKKDNLILKIMLLIALNFFITMFFVLLMCSTEELTKKALYLSSNLFFSIIGLDFYIFYSCFFEKKKK